MTDSVIDWSLKPTRRVVVGAIAAILTAIALQLAGNYEWAAFLGEVGVQQALPVLAAVLAAYMTADPKPAVTLKEFNQMKADLDRAADADPPKFVCHPLAVIIGFAVVLALGGCETTSTPEVRWAQAEKVYIGVMDILTDYRRPCVAGSGVVNAGPDHPLCLLDDAASWRVEAVRRVADPLLLRLGAADPEADQIMIATLMIELERALERLIAIQIEVQPRGGDG